MWNPDKQVPPGLPHYVYKQRVQWHGNVYEARDIEGTEPDDIPGISNHWILLFSCSECICAPDAFDHVILGDYKTNFEHGETTGFLSGIKFSYDSSEFECSSFCFFLLHTNNMCFWYKTHILSLLGKHCPLV